MTNHKIRIVGSLRMSRTVTSKKVATILTYADVVTLGYLIL